MIAVLYEDQRGPTKGFGPHRLAIQCVTDDTGAELWKVDKLFKAVPKKGVSNLLDACANAPLDPGGEPVFVLIDNDKIRSELKLPKGTADEDVVKAIKMKAPSRRLEVVLLKENMESIVAAVRECAGSPPLTRKPNPDERDAELSVAKTSELRRCVRTKVPSFDAFVVRLVEVLRGDAGLAIS